MLDNVLKEQVVTYLERMRRPVDVVASLDGSGKSRELRSLLEELATLGDKIHVRFDGEDTRRPSFSIGRPGETPRIAFAGIPTGHEFNSLVLALMHAGGVPPKVKPELLEQIRTLPGSYRFETYVTLSCHNCPDVVQALNLMAEFNPGISHTMIDGMLYRKEADALKIMAVPTMRLNGEPFGQGRKSLEQLIALLDAGAAERELMRLSAKDIFDVLVVGGGPAGASAAIYAARKGLRTGILAERLGGQVLDTASIENFISLRETDGARLSAGLEEHVRSYGIDLMALQRAESLAQDSDGINVLRTASGAQLRARTLIICTGAYWRELKVPGESEYRGRGLAYCVHCDAPLFRGKRVAVIGGGNSGVEAAIDLAGVVTHVTLLEYEPELRADVVLQRKLFSLPNVTVITQAQTVEVVGNGEQVTGLSYRDRINGESETLKVDGVFVQIGLNPNTQWLKGTLALTPYGEIEVDARGQTSLPGVFAAGDCTTVPYKQIVVAIGEGAKASLAAFDRLIRVSAPAD